ncbi:MAG: hypothetical protein HQM16_09035 [Deltaproteobacteria bacterium]|nr:hypothetical protein [Deltaproteobacteria bacterium]
MKPTCLIIAHRGDSGSEPENTLKAFESAYHKGADGIELDCHLTRDKKVVVSHDRNLKRITGENRDCCASLYRDLIGLDFGKKEKIPLLVEVFDLFLKKFAVINIEIKSTGVFTNGIEKHIAMLIKQYRCASQIIVSSFNPAHLLRFKRLMPQVRLGYLICEKQDWIARNRYAVRIVGPSTLNLQKELVTLTSFNGLLGLAIPQWIWTVNKKHEMEFWLDRGAQAIITNEPGLLKSVMAGSKKDSACQT